MNTFITRLNQLLKNPSPVYKSSWKCIQVLLDALAFRNRYANGCIQFQMNTRFNNRQENHHVTF